MSDIEKSMDWLDKARKDLNDAERRFYSAELMVRQALSKALRIEAYRLEMGAWTCDASPAKVCVYDGYEDTVHDNCLYCNEPEERK